MKYRNILCIYHFSTSVIRNSKWWCMIAGLFFLYIHRFFPCHKICKNEENMLFFLFASVLQFEKFLKANYIRNHFCVVHFLWYESDSEKSKIKLIAKISGYTVSSYLLINIICQFSYLYLFLTRTHAKLPYIIIFLQFFMKSIIRKV